MAGIFLENCIFYFQSIFNSASTFCPALKELLEAKVLLNVLLLDEE